MDSVERLVSTSLKADRQGIGQEMYDLIVELFPICRSITGDGVRTSLKMLQKRIPLEIREVKSGTRVFDWTVPREWNIKAAFVKDPSGNKIVDFEKSNLHVLNYSIPVHRRMSLDELRKHLYTVPEQPDAIPYRTSYYKENWGFCISHNQLMALSEGEYEVVIDSSLEDGHLTYGECFIKGASDAEVLFSTHICHPSLANDNLSGVALATCLASHLSERNLRYSYRFLFTSGTIGSITWLSLNESRLPLIKHGLILACVGDSGPVTYKKSRQNSAEIDRAVQQVLERSGDVYRTLDFSPYGYDERQFCSPGINLPVGCFMRTPHGEFPEYHTSGDNLDFVQPQYLADSFNKCWDVLGILEGNRTYLNLNPKCEPQLGRRGLYGSIGGNSDQKIHELAMLWVLSLSDGEHTLLDITEKSRLTFDQIEDAAAALHKHDLLRDLAE
jgi:aminopeptidase-like protein